MEEKIAIVGGGYVGLVSGACLSYMGFHVSIIEKNSSKLEALKKGKIPFYEPRLEELVNEALKNKRIEFFSNIKECEEHNTPLYYFITVGTPANPDGSCNIEHVHSAVQEIAQNVRKQSILVLKSTVPVGTAQEIIESLKQIDHSNYITIINNPEFLREGSAVKDFFNPERIILGASQDWALEKMKEVYQNFQNNGVPFFITNHETAELSKLAANFMLASRLSTVNQISSLASQTGANIKQIESILKTDSRIGAKYLHAGVGYGGSCFPKDVKSFIKLCQTKNVDDSVAKAVDQYNEQQKLFFNHEIYETFKNPSETHIALLGLSFKPRTDDIREAPALSITRSLLKKGYHLRVFDPKAQENYKKWAEDMEINQNIFFAQSIEEALKGAHALLICTEWHEFQRISPDFLKKHFLGRHIFDGKNILNPQRFKSAGFHYKGVGLS